MGVQGVTPVLNVSSIDESFAWFEALGWQRGFSWNQGGLIGEGPNAQGANEHGAAGFGSVCSGKAVHRNPACAYMKRSQVPVGPSGYGGPVKTTNGIVLGRIRDRAEPIARNPRPFSSDVTMVCQ